jgi:hypothetical protein
MAKKKSPFNQEMAIRGANRRLFARSPFVVEKLEESRQEFPRYKKDGTLAKKPWVKRQCEVCSAWVGSTKIAIDHIDPVVPPDGFPASFDMWDRITMFLKRLWCDKSNLQRICDDCHDKKTNAERIERLKIKYTQELDQLEMTIGRASGMRNLIGAHTNGYKDLLKLVNKYTAKKKTIGLEQIVERALRLKQQILALKASFDK